MTFFINLKYLVRIVNSKKINTLNIKILIVMKILVSL